MTGRSSERPSVSPRFPGWLPGVSQYGLEKREVSLYVLSMRWLWATGGEIEEAGREEIV